MILNSTECIFPVSHEHVYNKNGKDVLMSTEGTLSCSMILWLLIVQRSCCAKNICATTVQALNNLIFFTFAFLSFLGFLCVTPLVCVFFTGLAIYKFAVKRILKGKYKTQFRGFLDGSDVFWAIEEDRARSVINILVNIEISNTITCDKETCSKIRLELIRRISKSAIQHPKLLYKRRDEFGYSFWIDDKRFSIAEQIRIVPFENTNTFTTEHLGMLCNCPLPHNDSSLWEILIGCPCFKKSKQQQFENMQKIQILFRLHHALGDGVALMRFFIEYLLDKDNDCRLDNKIYSSRQNVSKSYAQNCHEFIQKSFQDFVAFKRIFTLIFLGPSHILRQILTRKPDDNVLHARPFTGEKLVSRYTENNGEKFSKLKAAKTLLGARRFMEVVMTVLSCSIEDFLRNRNNPVPDEMTVITPSRITTESVKLQLHNKFSVALQTIPINSNDINSVGTTRMKRILSKLSVIKLSHEQLQNSPEYMINYAVLWLLASLLPRSLLTPFIMSAHSSLAVSNLPGPAKSVKILGHKINNMVFWLPNRGTMGMGFSILSYQNNLQMGFICDRGVIDNQKEVDLFLETFIKNLDMLFQE